MPTKARNAAADHSLAQWYERSGIALFTETVEFRAKGNVELAYARRNELEGTFCAMDTIRIVSGVGTGTLRLNVGYGWREHQCNSPTTLILPANAEMNVQVPYRHSKWSLSLAPAVLEAQMHIPVERIVAAFERLSAQVFTNDCFRSLTKEIWRNSARETGCLGELFCDSASLALVTYLLNEELDFDQQIKRGGIAPHRMRMLIEFMSSRLGDKIRVAEMARLCGLSDYHFIRAFKRETGLTPYQYVLRMRINQASRLLTQHRNKGIEEIALMSGFGSPSTFGSQFRRLLGTSPQSYRDSTPALSETPRLIGLCPGCSEGDTVRADSEESGKAPSDARPKGG
jgi:AraC-like DNA-binding protein